MTAACITSSNDGANQLRFLGVGAYRCPATPPGRGSGARSQSNDSQPARARQGRARGSLHLDAGRGPILQPRELARRVHQVAAGSLLKIPIIFVFSRPFYVAPAPACRLTLQGIFLCLLPPATSSVCGRPMGCQPMI